MRRLAVLLCGVAFACGPSVDGDGGGGPDSGVAPQPDAAVGGNDAAPVPMLMYAHTADSLYVVDEQTFDVQLVGSFGLNMSEGGMTDLAVTPDGTIYGITRTKLWVVNEATGAATYLANVPGVDNVGMTFLPDGTLLATDKTGGVRRIEPANGNVSELGSFGGGYATAGDLVAVADGTMYAISDEGPVGDEWDNNVLLTVNTVNGAASPVGQIGYGGVFGCAVANNRVYAFTSAGEIIEINPTTGAGTLQRTHSGISFWGAGVTPRVTIE